MKQKWYLKTWFICVLFAFWFVYGVPLLLGIILLVLKNKQDKDNLLIYENLLSEHQECKQALAALKRDIEHSESNNSIHNTDDSVINNSNPADSESSNAQELQEVDVSAESISEAKAKPETRTERHRVAGTSYRQDVIESLGSENDCYTWTKKELAEYDMCDQNIYQLEFSPESVELVEEPENEHDPNAIKVVVDGEHVGYIKKGSCSHVKKLIHENRICEISVDIYGGKYKRVSWEYDPLEDKDSYDLECGKTDYFVSIYLTIKC